MTVFFKVLGAVEDIVHLGPRSRGTAVTNIIYIQKVGEIREMLDIIRFRIWYFLISVYKPEDEEMWKYDFTCCVMVLRMVKLGLSLMV
jgi:hypothetical protein